MGCMNRKKDFFQPLVDKLNQRRLGWRTQFLTQGGRLTLIKSTIASLPNYTLSYFKAPKYICDKMDQVVRGFRWGHEPKERKLHLRSWNDICQRKQGGLGIRKTKDMNKALL